LKVPPRLAGGKWPVAAALLSSVLLASCSSTGSPELEMSSLSPASEATDQKSPEAVPSEPRAAGSAEASLAMQKPLRERGEEEAGASTPSSQSNSVGETAAATTVEAEAATEVAEAAPEQAAAGQMLRHGGAVLTAGVMPNAQLIEPKKKSFLSAFFGSSPAAAAPSPLEGKDNDKDTEENGTKPAASTAAAKPAAKEVKLASLGSSRAAGDYVLPGVRQDELFEIKRKSGIDDISDIDIYEDIPSLQVASAAGMARMAPNGLLKQRDDVDVGCLKPELVRMLKTIERRFGKKMVITSGYRSPAHNRRVNGAARSQHMYCSAVDVQIPGVSKWELAKYARSLPGRGGVGTYCHASVHIDVGPERDWNWRCKRGSS
jgi:uncharacterized protein YcbK (DUF882 family)